MSDYAIGTMTKVHFTCDKEMREELGLGGESMWGTITEVDGKLLRAKLENEPFVFEGIYSYGEELWFELSDEWIPEFVGKEKP